MCGGGEGVREVLSGWCGEYFTCSAKCLAGLILKSPDRRATSEKISKFFKREDFQVFCACLFFR